MKEFRCNGCGKEFTEKEVQDQINSDSVCCDADGFGLSRISFIANSISGKSVVEARRVLDDFDFSPAESSEIIHSHWRRITDSVDPDWQAVAVTIESSLRLSVTLGLRNGLHI